MTKAISLKINGASVKADSITVSNEMGRLYQVATFTMSKIPVGGAVVHISIGDCLFEGFVYKASRTGKNSWSVECRSHTARLTTPFDYPQEGLEAASTASALMEVFAQRAGITINYRSEELYFGNSYQRSGTMLDEIQAVAAVTGSEIFCVNSTTLDVRPHYGITHTGYEVPRSDYYDFLPNEVIFDPGAVGKIVIGDGIDTPGDDGDDGDDGDNGEIENDTDYRAEISIDGCGNFKVLTTVSGVRFKGHRPGIHSCLTPVVEDLTVQDTHTIALKTIVSNISAIYVNGIKYNNYTFWNNVVSCLYPISGAVHIEYTGKCYKGMAKRFHTDLYDGYTITVFTYDGKVLSAQTVKADCNKPYSPDPVPRVNPKVDPSCGKWLLDMPNTPTYHFEFISVGPKVEAEFYEDFGTTPSKIGFTCSYKGDEPYLIAGTGDNALEYDANNVYVELDFDPIEIVEFYTSTSNSTGYRLDGKKLYWNKVLRHVKFSYTTTGHKYQVDGYDTGDIGVYMQVIPPLNCWKPVEYDLKNEDAPKDPQDPNEIGCSLPIDVAVNVSSQLSISVAQCAGKSITVSPGSVTLTVDNLGYVSVNVTQNGRYTLDCSSISPRAKIYLDVDTGG